MRALAAANGHPVALPSEHPAPAKDDHSNRDRAIIGAAVLAAAPRLGGLAPPAPAARRYRVLTGAESAATAPSATNTEPDTIRWMPR